MDDLSADARRRTLKRLYLQGWRHPGQFLGMLALMAAYAGFTAVLVLVVERLAEFFNLTSLQDIDDQVTVGAQRLQAGIDMMWQTTWLLLMATPLAAASAYFSWLVAMRLSQRCMVELRSAFIGKLVALDLGQHSMLARGDLYTRLSGDMERVQELMGTIYGKFQQRPFEILAMMVVLVALDWRLALIVFAIMIAAGLSLVRTFRRTRRRSERERQKVAATLDAAEQIASGVRVIKTMGSREREIGRFDHANEAVFNAAIRVQRSKASAKAVTLGATYIVVAVLLAAGAWGLQRGLVELDKLLVFIFATSRIAVVLRQVQNSIGGIITRLPSARRVFELMDTRPLVTDRPGASDVTMPRSSIRLEQVDFRYDGDSEWVLHRCDLDIPIGATIALVGESGAGKSTILDLIPRLYDVTNGRVVIDGLDVRDCKHDQLIQLFGIVQQDSFLFNDAVRANIAYGRPEASEEEIVQAAKRAHVHQAILELEGGLGYDTPVGDRGERLSGGQRQRIAIARAFLRDAPILLLDEPTSALDADSERHVQQALAELMRGRTCVVVAHRLSTIQHADRIVVIGRERRGVVEQGTHQELLELDGIYARLVEQQRLMQDNR